MDNGRDGTEYVVPDIASIVYMQVDGEKTTGAMRNLCAELAQGEIICHFDSDDWSAPERVAEQVNCLGLGVMTGYCTMLFYDERNDKAYRWSTDTHRFILGTSLCYRKAWWVDHQFPDMPVGEDFYFTQQGYREAKLKISTEDVGQMMVARVHEGQTCRKTLVLPKYQPIPCNQLPEAFRALQHHHEPR